MIRRPMLATLILSLVLMLVASGASLAAGATTASDVSAFATPIVEPVANEYRYSGHGFESVRYRPRRERYYHERGPSTFHGTSQIHAGFLDPEGPSDAGFLVGFRGGQKIDEMVELGLGVDWRSKSGNATEVLQESTGPGGETIVVRRQINRFSSNLFPVLAYLQVSGPSDLGLVPYFGAAASYQALFLSAEDFQTGQQFDATYAGWGWQLWGGAAFPLGGRSKLVGELFLNNADLSRDVFDPVTGEALRETVSANGVGARFGLNWGF